MKITGSKTGRNTDPKLTESLRSNQPTKPMSNKPITAKIDVTKILKDQLFIGKKGKFLDLAIWPNKNGPDEYGNTHYITQQVSKEAREKGVRGEILGNLKMNYAVSNGGQASARPVAKPAVREFTSSNDDGDIPF